MSRTTSARRGTVALAASAALVMTSMSGAFGAKGVPGPPHPPSEEETGTNNLSVPALFVPSTTGSPFTGTCTDGVDDSADPSGLMGVDLNADGVADEHLDYYVQGVATWQADCATAAADALTVGAEWGDNLTSAPLKAGTPIRVEIGFLADATANPMPGYVVEKLDPTLLDRESHYGTKGVEVLNFPEVRVWNNGVTLDIRSKDGTVVVADTIAYSAEVNSTGRVVYGFNWQKPVAGEYTVTVKAPTIYLATTDAGSLSDTTGDGKYDTVELTVNVGNKGGGGGGGGGRPTPPPGQGGGGGPR